MATIYLKLSKKVQQKTQMSEIIIRLRNGNDYDLLVKSGIFITADNFKDGKLVVNRRKVGNDVKYHEKMKDKLEELEKHILNSVNDRNKEDVTKAWLVGLVDRFMHPENYMTEDERNASKTVYELFDDYIKEKGYSYDQEKAVLVLERDIARYEGYVRELGGKEDFAFNVNSVTRDDIEDFFCYLRNEKKLSEEYPETFKRLLSLHPAGIGRGWSKISERGDNSLMKMKKRLKAFFSWLYETGKTDNKPFVGVKIGSGNYGTPYYITIDERNILADASMPTKHLETQRTYSYSSALRVAV